MRKDKAGLLLHPVFLISLAVLLLNDFYWKYAYHNWLTGKLSDFAGLIVLPVFLLAIFPKLSKRSVVLFSLLFFAWWKSPFSQPLIDALSSVLHITLHRTVDYSDLLAFAVSPIVFKMQPWQYNINPTIQKSATYISGFAALFALCATSPIRHMPYSHYTQNEVRLNEELCTIKTSDELFKDLQNKGLAYVKETERYYPLDPGYRELYYRIEQKDSSLKWVPISFTPDSVVYIKRDLYRPSYLISFYGAGEEIFKNIRFEVTPVDSKKKRTCITVLSFESEKGTYGLYPTNKQKKKLKKYFSELFSIPEP